MRTILTFAGRRVRWSYDDPTGSGQYVRVFVYPTPTSNATMATVRKDMLLIQAVR